MKTRIFLLAFIACQLSAATVTGGFVRVTGQGSVSGEFTLSGENFSASGQFGGPLIWPTDSCAILLVGDSCSPKGYVLGNDFGNGSGTVNGTTHSVVRFGDLHAEKPSIFDFVGGSIAIPGPGMFSGPFTFQGSLCGTDEAGIQNPCLVDLPELTGSGIVTMTVHEYLVEPGIIARTVSEATYTFLVPEPNTFLLAVSVFLLLGLRTLRYR
jgi:hypothetical protein